MGSHVKAGAGGIAISVPPLRAPRWAVTCVTAPLWRRRTNQQHLHPCSLSEGLPSPSLASPTGVRGSPGSHRLLDLGSPASLTLSVPGRGCPRASRVRWPVHAAHRGNTDVIQPTLAQLHPNSGEDFTDTLDPHSGPGDRHDGGPGQPGRPPGAGGLLAPFRRRPHPPAPRGAQGPPGLLYQPVDGVLPGRGGLAGATGGHPGGGLDPGIPDAGVPPGLRLAPVSPSHVPLLNATWGFGGNARSARFLLGVVGALPSACLLDPRARPVSWTLLDPLGCLSHGYTLPAWRGRGLCGVTLGALGQELHARGFPVYLGVLPQNTPSQRAVRAAGFLPQPGTFYTLVVTPK
ncbi:uncharacterized protein FN964_004874 isoform 1-T1 [Alca torda]